MTQTGFEHLNLEFVSSFEFLVSDFRRIEIEEILIYYH